MKISVASIQFEIDDILLTQEAIARLQPFSMNNKNINENIPEYHIVRNEHEVFTKAIQPSIRLNSIEYLEQESKFFIRTYSFSTTIDIVNRFMEVTPSSDWPKDAFSVLKVLKLLISIVCVQHQSILLHSSMAFKGNTGLVFTGNSGTGKTTILKMIRFSWIIMNDEYNILRIKNNKVIGYSTPFGRIRGQVDAQPSIKAIFFIKQSTSNQIVPFTEHTPALKLMTNVCTFPSSDRIGLQLIETINLITDMIYISNLYFMNKPELAYFLDQFRLAA